MGSENEVKTKFTADSSGFTAAVDKANQRITAYAQSTGRSAEVLETFQKALDESGASTNQQVQQIAKAVMQMDKMATTAGKTQSQLAAMRAESLNISSAMQKYIADLDEAAQHTHEFTLNSTAARRELLVLAHEASQGSWKRFGGSLMVLGEATDALSLLFSGAGLAVGAFAATVAAAYLIISKGSAETKQLNAALQLTSNYAGLTGQSFADMAEHVSSGSGSTLSQAKTVLMGLAESGRYTSSEMAGLAQVILRTSQISGASLEDVGKEYAKLAEDPAKWALAHNESMHFMDSSTYEHIKALQEAGDKHSAMAAVIASANSQIRASTEKEIGTATSALHEFARAFSSIFNDITHQQSVSEQHLSASFDAAAKLRLAQNAASQISPNSKSYADAQQRVADAQKEVDATRALVDADKQRAAQEQKSAETRQAAIESEVRIDAMRDRIMSNAEKRAKALAQLDRDRANLKADGNPMSDADYQKMVTDINREYKDPSNGSASRQRDTINAAMAQQQTAIQQFESDRKDALAKAKADYDTGASDYAAYYAKVKAIDTQAYADELAAAQKRADLAGQKKEKTAREQALQEVQRIQAKLKQAETDYTAAMSTEQAKRAASLDRYWAQQQEIRRRIANAYQAEDDTRYMSSDAKAAYADRLRLQDAYEKERASLKEQYESRKIDQDEYDAKSLIAAQSFEAQENQLKAHLEREQAIRESYGDQIQLAIAQIGNQGKTNAQYVGEAFTTAWSDAQNALDSYLTTGEGSFAKFTASVLADLAKIALHAAEMQIFNGVANFFSTGGEVGHFAGGGAIIGPGSGTSDSIPAMLSNGEYVINAASTKKYRGLLESINSGHMAHFATGGAVGSVAPASSVSSGSGGDLHFHLDGSGGGLTPEDAKALLPQFQAMLDKRINQRFRGQGGLALIAGAFDRAAEDGHFP